MELAYRNGPRKGQWRNLTKADIITEEVERGGKRVKEPVAIFVTGLGIPDAVGMTISGHKDIDSYPGCAHTQGAAQRAALEQLEAFIDKHAGEAATVTALTKPQAI